MNRPILAGNPTVEVDQERYEMLLYAELKSQQYRGYLEKTEPEIVEIIDGIKENDNENE